LSVYWYFNFVNDIMTRSIAVHGIDLTKWMPTRSSRSMIDRQRRLTGAVLRRSRELGSSLGWKAAKIMLLTAMPP
jgi:hypothetical protein